MIIAYARQGEIKAFTHPGDYILFSEGDDRAINSGVVKDIDPLDDKVVIENINGEETEDTTMEFKLSDLTFYRDTKWEENDDSGSADTTAAEPTAPDAAVPEIPPVPEDIDGFKVNERFYDIPVLCRNATTKQSSKGSPYMACNLVTRKADIPAKMWSFYGTAEDFNNRVCIVSGKVDTYNGAKQIIIEDIRQATEKEADEAKEHLLPSSPNFYTDHSYVLNILDAIKDEDYHRLCDFAVHKYWNQFKDIPAAEKVHHAFLHGLLMHTANMLRIASFVADTYIKSGLRIDKSLLLAGTFLHDIGKIAEYNLNDLGLVASYSTQGSLIGHLVMGAMDVAEMAKEINLPEEKKLLMMHMLLSHHGEPDWGAAVRPLCVEADILSRLDMLDAQMEIFRGVQDKTEQGSFSEKEFFLGNRRIFCH